MQSLYIFVFFCLICAVSSTQTGDVEADGRTGKPCDDFICAPRVSKCMLLDDCNCTITSETLKNKSCECCRQCSSCLADLYTECCSCVGLCKPPKGFDPTLTLTYYVHDLKPGEDEQMLFELLTIQDDEQSRWAIYSFPAIETAGFIRDQDQENENKNENEVSVDQRRTAQSLKDVNCTVAFMSQCCSMEKCQNFCVSMGASSLRWFHNGCCECAGKTCLNYGLREAKCKKCPEYPAPFDGNELGKDEL